MSMGERRTRLPRSFFLKFLFVVGVASQVRSDAHLGPANFDHNFDLDLAGDGLGFERVVQMTLRLNRIAASFNYRPEISPERIHDWTEKTLAYLRLTGVGADGRPPKILEFRELIKNRGGLSDCETKVMLEIDFLNPDSSLYRSSRFLPTLIHEIFHLQQGVLCEMLDNGLVELAAQVVTWTVLAAIARGEKNNDWGSEAALALVLEIRRATLNTAFLYALRDETKRKQFQELVRGIYGFAAGDVLVESMTEYWSNPTLYQQFLEKYYEKPLALITRAYLTTNGVAQGLPLNRTEAHYVGGGSPYVFDGSMPFDINPLVYFLEHAGSIIEGYT